MTGTGTTVVLNTAPIKIHTNANLETNAGNHHQHDRRALAHKQQPHRLVTATQMAARQTRAVLRATPRVTVATTRERRPPSPRREPLNAIELRETGTVDVPGCVELPKSDVKPG